MKHRSSPILRPLYWTDGTQALPVEGPDLTAWLSRGVSAGWVVAADNPEHAKKIGQALDERTEGG